MFVCFFEKKTEKRNKIKPSASSAASSPFGGFWREDAGAFFLGADLDLDLDAAEAGLDEVEGESESSE